jgi:hypothetical protein
MYEFSTFNFELHLHTPAKALDDWRTSSDSLGDERDLGDTWGLWGPLEGFAKSAECFIHVSLLGFKHQKKKKKAEATWKDDLSFQKEASMCGLLDQTVPTWEKERSMHINSEEMKAQWLYLQLGGQAVSQIQLECGRWPSTSHVLTIGTFPGCTVAQLCLWTPCRTLMEQREHFAQIQLGEPIRFLGLLTIAHLGRRLLTGAPMMTQNWCSLHSWQAVTP